LAHISFNQHVSENFGKRVRGTRNVERGGFCGTRKVVRVSAALETLGGGVRGSREVEGVSDTRKVEGVRGTRNVEMGSAALKRL
jgi:hypothetical protein